MAGWEARLMVLAPLVAVATLALGLQIGAARPVHAAVVFGAPPARARTGLSWELLTLLDDRGVRESVPMEDVTVTARAAGHEASWAGSTNADGIAELWLDLPGVKATDAIELEIRTRGERVPLASGIAAWPTELPGEASASAGVVRPSKQDGPLSIEVAVYGGRLAPTFESSVWVRVKDGATGLAVPAAVVHADPEPGLTLGANRVTASASGWAELRATAEAHVLELRIRAEDGSDGSRRGEWYGALPVAPGGAFARMPLTFAPGEATAFEILVPTVLPRVYAEVDDALGRARAAALTLAPSPLGGHAKFEAGPLEEGTYWLVTSSAPGGAPSSEGGKIARPFVVSERPSAYGDLGPTLALLGPPAMPRWVALDGLPGRRRGDGKRHAFGLVLAFGSLVAAAILETLLILRGVKRSRRALARVAEGVQGDVLALERRFSAASVAIGLLVALLGFGLLAALLTWRPA